MTVDLSLRCERPVGQLCDTTTFIIYALGSSGNNYAWEPDPTIPELPFGLYLLPHLYGGRTEPGKLGFLITQIESNLRMSVQIFQGDGEFFFWIGGSPPD